MCVWRVLGLGTPPRSKRLDVALRQVQGHVGLANMADPRHLSLVVSQVQGNNHPLLACLRE
jgi:hypothetical protein